MSCAQKAPFFNAEKKRIRKTTQKSGVNPQKKRHNEGAFNSLFFAQKKRLSHALGFPKKIRLSPASTGRRLRAPFFWRTNAPSPCNWATTTSPRLRPPVKKSCDNIGKFILFKCLERLHRVVWTSAQGTKAPRAGASSELEHLEEESRKQDRWTRFRHLVTTELKLPYSARKSQFQREREKDSKTRWGERVRVKLKHNEHNEHEHSKYNKHNKDNKHNENMRE